MPSKLANYDYHGASGNGMYLQYVTGNISYASLTDAFLMNFTRKYFFDLTFSIITELTLNKTRKTSPDDFPPSYIRLYNEIASCNCLQ